MRVINDRVRSGHLHRLHVIYNWAGQLFKKLLTVDQNQNAQKAAAINFMTIPVSWVDNDHNFSQNSEFHFNFMNQSTG